jgi:hypothetical protein
VPYLERLVKLGVDCRSYALIVAHDLPFRRAVRVWRVYQLKELCGHSLLAASNAPLLVDERLARRLLQQRRDGIAKGAQRRIHVRRRGRAWLCVSLLDWGRGKSS